MKLLTYDYSSGYFWFRIFGYGLRFANRKKHKPLFSVRNGYTKEYLVAGWGIITLRPCE